MVTEVSILGFFEFALVGGGMVYIWDEFAKCHRNRKYFTEMKLRRMSAKAQTCRRRQSINQSLRRALSPR